MTSKAYTKSRFLKEFAYKLGVRKTLSQKALDALTEIIYREAARGGLALSGICKFDVVQKKARRIRNPRTGEVLIIPPHKALRVTLSNAFKRSVAPKPRAMTLEEYESFKRAEEAAAAMAAISEAQFRAASQAPAPADPAPAAVAPVAAPEPVPPPAPAPAAEAPKAEEPAPAPTAEVPKAEEPKVEPPAAETPPPAVGNSGAISFRCSKCHQEIEAPAEVIGMDAECPMCGAIVVVPAESEPGTMYGPMTDDRDYRSTEPTVSAKEAEDMDPQQLKNRTIRIDTTLFGFDDEDSKPATPPPGEGKEDTMVSFFCKNCHQEIEATLEMAGAQCECPNCGNSMEVPYFSDPGSIHDTHSEAARKRAESLQQAQKHSTMRINLDDF